ncbi:hypothetical protein Bca4012_051415 [Brassica carinata]
MSQLITSFPSFSLITCFTSSPCVHISIIEAETGRTHRSPPNFDPPLAPGCHHRLFPSSWSYRHVRERDSLAISGQTDVLLPRIEQKRCIYDVRRRCTKTEPPSHHRGTDQMHRCKP